MEKEIDPVCGMTVDAASPYKAKVGDRTYHFCSDQCLTKFQANPSQYTGAAAASGGAQGEKHEPPHTGHGIFTAPKFGSAGSGGAEYELLPEKHADDPDRKHGKI